MADCFYWRTWERPYKTGKQIKPLDRIMAAIDADLYLIAARQAAEREAKARSATDSKE